MIRSRNARRLNAAHRYAVVALGAALITSPAYAQPFPPQDPLSATAGSNAVESLPDGVFSGKRDRDVLVAQVLLDRARFSPGVIDGFGGGNTARAVKAWQRSKGVEASGRVDAALLASLGQDREDAVVTSYTLTEVDVAGPFGKLPEGMEALAELEAPHYENVAEAIAEKFHMSQELLRALNPDIDGAAAGAQVTVTSIRTAPIKGAVARIEVDSAAATLRAFSADGQLLASYPATVGSADFPSPSGSMEVRVIAAAPAYYFSPEGRDWGPDKRLTIAPGPNNPVGSTWIDLTKKGYGIHGTPDPRLIGKTPSHGCVRLTNWDAQELAKAVKSGTTVEFL